MQADSALMFAANAGKEENDWRLEQQALTGASTLKAQICHAIHEEQNGFGRNRIYAQVYVHT